MNKYKINAVLHEIDRFEKCAHAVAEGEKTNKYIWISDNTLTGALRRASLDLMRSLAEMRKR